MATLGGTSLGYIRNEQQTKSSNLFNQPMPATDSSGALILDLFGVSRNISISGTVTGSVATIQAFINTLEGYQNGSQAVKSFVSSIHSAAKNVYINNFTWTYAEGKPTILNYTLDLIEGI
jgi:hypothetical protein